MTQNLIPTRGGIPTGGGIGILSHLSDVPEGILLIVIPAGVRRRVVEGPAECEECEELESSAAGNDSNPHPLGGIGILLLGLGWHGLPETIDGF
jgi:hypothetical protein